MILYSDPAYGYKEGIAMTQTQAFPPFKKLSFYSETHTVALPYTIASTGQNTDRMETAKDILDNNAPNWKGEDCVPRDQAIKAMQEIADKAWEAGVEHGFDPERYYSTEEAKAAFMKSLFPLKEI